MANDYLNISYLMKRLNMFNDLILLCSLLFWTAGKFENPFTK